MTMTCNHFNVEAKIISLEHCQIISAGKSVHVSTHVQLQKQYSQPVPENKGQDVDTDRRQCRTGLTDLVKFLKETSAGSARGITVQL
ncbi:hypothetical protein BaRGS_00037956 [Batillaria attramentaria]|uniref:Uncharacterized protein n=1 Tax=Batillaria attramentaria TaxID=370345 RepID=A0ABD0J7A0_9CAEN